MKGMQIVVVGVFVLTTTVLANGSPIERSAFDGTEHLITFTPGWGYAADPIMYQTVTCARTDDKVNSMEAET